MDELNLTTVANNGVLGAIAAVAIWGVVKGFGALWALLLKREDQLDRTHRDLLDRLESLSETSRHAAQTAAQEAATLRHSVERLIDEVTAARTQLSPVLTDLGTALSSYTKEDSVNRDA